MCVSMRLPVRWISNAEIIIYDAETTWRIRGEIQLQRGQGEWPAANRPAEQCLTRIGTLLPSSATKDSRSS